MSKEHAMHLSVFLLFKFLSKNFIIAALTAYFIRGIVALCITLLPSMKCFLMKEWNDKEVVWQILLIDSIFVTLAVHIALPKCNKNRFFNCVFLRCAISLTVAFIIVNWFQAAQGVLHALLYVAPCVIGLVVVHWLWDGEVKQDGTNHLMGKVWDWNMYGTKLKKSDGSYLHTACEDGKGGEDDASAVPEDSEGDPEDGYGDEEDATDPWEEDTTSSEDDYGDQDDRRAPSEESDDDVPCGQRTVQLLAIRANLDICAINGYDMQISQCIYRQHEGEVQEEGMIDLVPTGPSEIFMAYGGFSLEFFHPIRKDSHVCGPPLTLEWDVCRGNNKKPKEYTRTICCGRPRGMFEITYLVIPNTIETNVEFKLKLKDIGSRSRTVYGKIKVCSPDYGNKRVHLFSRGRGRSWSVPSGPTSILPLSPSVVALPYRRQLEFDIEVDLTVITIIDNQEEDKSLKFSLKFTRGIRSQEREVEDDQVEVGISFNPEI